MKETCQISQQIPKLFFAAVASGQYDQIRWTHRKTPIPMKLILSGKAQQMAREMGAARSAARFTTLEAALQQFRDVEAFLQKTGSSPSAKPCVTTPLPKVSASTSH